MDAGRILAQAAADFRRGYGAPITDILIAALVVLPFTGTLAILIGPTGLPDAVLIVVIGVLQGLATFWNAGWRARPTPAGDHGG